MARRRRPGPRLLVACAAMLLAAGASVAGAADDGLVIKKLERTISLKTPIVSVSDELEVAATSGSNPPPSRFLLCYTRPLADRLAYLELEVAGKAQGGWSRLTDAELKALAGGETSSENAGCFAVPLDAAATKALGGGKTKLSAYASFARALDPRPSSVAQDEPQHVLFADGALRAVSPYSVEAQTVEALIPHKPLGFSPGAPVGSLKSPSSTSTGGAIKFSPVGSTAPWAALSAKVRADDGGGKDAALSVHFPMNEPLVRGLRVTRDVEVSHWGNVYVEETYLVRNDGPLLDGEFSRRRYSDRSGFLGHMFENLRARLPPGSRWIYFRDSIGNVSTSAVHRLPKGASLSLGDKAPHKSGGSDDGSGSSGGAVVVDLGMRYPMVGGWQADFVLGYSLPLGSVVSRVSGTGVGGRMRLRLPLPAPIEGMYADELDVKVVLPEGSRAIAHAAPSAPNARASHERKRAYLDAPWGKGRPVLRLVLPNAVPDHAAGRLTVEYSVRALDLMRKPLLLCAAYAFVFAALALLNRADFSIVSGGGGKNGGGGGFGGKGSSSSSAAVVAAQKAKAA